MDQAEEGTKYLDRATSLPCSLLHSCTEDGLFCDPLPIPKTSTYLTVSVGRKGSGMGCKVKVGPHLSYLCRNPDEIYELYDAVEATGDSSLSPRGRGL